MEVFRSLRVWISGSLTVVPVTGVLAALCFVLACGSVVAQTTEPALPDGPRPAMLPLDETEQSASGVSEQTPQTPKPSPIAPSRVNAGSKATPGPLTQAERNQYVFRQLTAPSHLIGYSLGALYKMANPPGRGSTYYPKEWRVGGEGFGRNFGDQAAEDQTKHIAKYGSGALLREDPRYYPSESGNIGMRAMHAVMFTLVDRSNDGALRPALSNLVGAAAGGYVGDAYLPAGFRNQAHATQRSLVNLAGFAGENALAEFKPEIRQALLKLHLPFVK